MRKTGPWPLTRAGSPSSESLKYMQPAESPLPMIDIPSIALHLPLQNECKYTHIPHYPITHLLPGIKEMSFAVMKQLAKVPTAMHGIAAAAGRASSTLKSVTQTPSQNICIR